MKTLTFAALIVLLTTVFGYLSNLPQAVGLDIPEGKLNSLSFAPFREGQGPLDAIFPSVAEMEADLQLMSKKTHTIRVYASSEGNMPALPPLAKKYGLTILQGAWLGMGPKDNQLEINALIKAANNYPEVIKRVIVGNEVLLRGDLKPEQLIDYIRTVKRAVKQPVSYADVWSMYMKYPQLIKEVDFITIHILPYWEDEPIAVEIAPAHIARIYKQVQQEANAQAPGIPILIGESGWPGEGRQRGRAIPSVVNEAKFIRGLIKVATDNGFDYNIVEAINQSWKSELEGVVGANWGLYSVDRQEVFPLTGKVYENPRWLQNTLTTIGLFLLVVGIFWKPLQTLSSLPLLGLLTFTQLLLLLGVHQLEYLWYTSYSDWQRLQTVFLSALNLLLGGLMVRRLYELLSKNAINLNIGMWFNALYWLVIAYALYKTYCLATYSRYVSFPTEATAIPVMGIIGLILSYYLTIQPRFWPTFSLSALPGGFEFKTSYHRLIGITLLSLGVLMMVEEVRAFVESRDFTNDHPALSERLRLAVTFTVGNKQLLAWLFSIGILSIPLLRSKRLVL
ncbi:MAG: exo-beta-1,3-glucanase [Methylococcaceae bacterium]|nr:exo-beta-1,3-glucanase [Methylococcaceae bacterium]